MTNSGAAVAEAPRFLQSNEGEMLAWTFADQAALEGWTSRRRFQKAIGMTATDYVQRFLVAKAQELLNSTIIEKNARLGGCYSDASAFREIFFESLA
ncbi:hypothetical protein [Agrobacterium burrii]|uniref:Uncharacterized protein n=1 Tax=Agrobacterium burrii TaxID=2815339 RepID=A0ABS3EQF7_9HYPH|nr:hypothetical protein [Agrobacterium burrii]MBO0134204.1 hypothetical protein [Agrobacterium burrii]